jgi:cytochrome b561
LLARVFHWTSAFVIVWALGSGFSVALGLLPPSAGKIISPFNASITALLIPIFVLRLLYRLCFTAPTLPLPRRQRLLAHGAHATIYVVALLSMLSGVLMMERRIEIFGWFSFPSLLSKSDLTKLISRLHFSSNFMLLLLLILHVGAVIKHHRNGFPVLKRMSW